MTKSGLIKQILSYLFLYGVFVAVILGYGYDIRIAARPLGWIFLSISVLFIYVIYVLVNHLIISRVISNRILCHFDILLFITLVIINITDVEVSEYYSREYKENQREKVREYGGSTINIDHGIERSIVQDHPILPEIR